MKYIVKTVVDFRKLLFRFI